MPTNVLILGAAGRDFHNFNVVYRGNADYRVVGFTAAQIPDIAGRRYPAALAGDGYPRGIPIFEEAELEALIDRLAVDEVVFAYSDVTHEHVMHLAARAVAAGAAFRLEAAATMLPCPRPLVAVTATRTGTGKSQTSREIRRVLAEAGKRVAAIRHPMPYGDLARQRVQRFAKAQDLDDADVTIEEREEYEPYLRDGAVIFAGVDYAAILEHAAAEADVIVWDGGNNDLPFYRPDLWICVLDPFRAGHELLYWPGEVNLRRADVVIINKMDTAPADGVEVVRANVAAVAPHATVIEAASPITVDAPDAIEGRRVLVVDDGPTITHGEMPFGAGAVAAQRWGAAELIDPRPFATGSIAGVYEKYPHIGPVLPAMGYSDTQRAELEATIRNADPDTVVIGTPIDLARVIDLGDLPSTRVAYELEVIAGPSLETVLQGVINQA
ncbi:MAG TPA: GTPase [Acidimicrobiia bacterium]|jgi:predicted GTPase|nr:GTPase [Acidimicrobiia bacterium]